MSRTAFRSSRTASTAFESELQLLYLCARSELDAERIARLQLLLARPLDWEAVEDAAVFHGVTGMLYHHLARHGTAHVPADLLLRLQQHAQCVQVYNMQVMTELVRIASVFRAQGIPLLTYKGPALAHRYYGSVALRRFGDVDLLVRRDDLERARDLLEEHGYVPLRSLSEDQEDTWHDAQLGYELHHEAKGVVVELHWALLNRTLTFRLTPEAVWARAHTVRFGSTMVRVLAPDDLLLYLCAHGTKHHWSRLLWVCDVAQVLRGHPDRDWTALLRRARSLGSLRTLLLGVALAERWLGEELPPVVREEIAARPAVDRLVEEVEARWFGTTEGLVRPAGWATFWFAFRTHQRLRDNVALLRHHAWLAVTPTERDRAFVSLPPSLDGLYYLVRPLRLLRDGGRSLTRLLSGVPSNATRHE